MAVSVGLGADNGGRNSARRHSLLLILGYYYLTAARSEMTGFFRATVHARFAVLVFFVAFVVLRLAPPLLLVFGVIDALAATWTALALRERRGW